MATERSRLSTMRSLLRSLLDLMEDEQLEKTSSESVSKPSEPSSPAISLSPVSGLSALSGLKGKTGFEVAWAKATLNDLCVHCFMLADEKQPTFPLEKTIGVWTTKKLFGTVCRFNGYPIALAIGHRAKGQKQVRIQLWGVWSTVEHTDLFSQVMMKFIDSFPSDTKSVVFMAPDDDLPLHNELKGLGFKCIKTLENHYGDGKDGYLFIKRLGNDPDDEPEEEECPA